MASIEIDGKTIKAKEGAMVIEAADDAGIYIPRFCYHKKLSIAANCRMCLIEVEKVGKPLPACATPVTDGMKIFTRSPKAIAAQKGVMEFLLINHPLDCPICDQGGECELQDIAMGYGGDLSRFSEQKRVVLNKDLGPLIATDMTRCIHCTRCVRFGEEIAGFRELGATGRGEHTEIGTYIKHQVASELSGNVIDLCPVGALTSKPFRFAARSWELLQRDTIAPHDCIGSNLSVHVRNNEVIRVVPRDNEEINETWISDRDRFSYEALNSEQRLTTPMIKVKGQWQETDWNTALLATVDGFRRAVSDHGPERAGALASATSTLEELYLLQKLMRANGVNNIDHRVRQADFRDQEVAPVFPWLGQSIQDLESNNGVLLVGSNIRKEQPIAAHRLRKATHRGAKIMCLNSVDYDFFMPIAAKIIVHPASIAYELAGIAKALLTVTGIASAEGFDSLLDTVEANETHKVIAEHLVSGEISSVLLGPQAVNHPDAASISALSSLVSQLSNSRFGYLSEAGNTSGAWIAGAIPHRTAGGKTVPVSGRNAAEMLQNGLNAYILLNLEPEVDSMDPNAARQSLTSADFVVSMSCFDNESIRDYADVLLPIGPYTETSGTLVNAAGQWQSFNGAVNPKGDARPAWKVLRVLGNLFEQDGFDYVNPEDVLDEIRKQTGDLLPDNMVSFSCPAAVTKNSADIVRITEPQMYAGDGMQRRANALQRTPDAVSAAIRINKKLADRTGLADGDEATARQNGNAVTLPVIIDNSVSDGSVLIHSGLAGSAQLDSSFTPITLKRV